MGELTLWTPSTTLSIEQEAKQSSLALKYATSPQEALRQVRKLVGGWPHARPPDPEGWAASLAATLAQYPLGVVQECCDPRVGLVRGREFPPTVAAIVEWCDRRLTYHRGMVKWGQNIVEEPAFSDEHRKTMLERLKALMHGLFDREISEEARP
jgi:hypothetical protein